MNVLITGGNGFIATNFIKNALSKGYQITSIDNLSYAGSSKNHEIFLSDKSYTFIKEDIRSRSMEDIIRGSGFDAVLNFAAESHVDRSIHDDTHFISTNITGTHNLLNICKKQIQEKKLKENFKFIQISTDEVYGSLKPDEPAFTEFSILKPSNPYSATKASADLLCISYFKTHNFPVLITRCSNNYGPYQHPEKLIPLTIHRLNNNNKIPIYGSGKQIRDWIYVDDHCLGIMSALEKGRLGEIYNFGGSSESTNINCVNKLIEHLKPGKNIEAYVEFIRDRPGHDARYAIDASKAFKELHWTAENTFSQGIAKTIDWYNNNPSWLDDITNNEEYKEWEKTNY